MALVHILLHTNARREAEQRTHSGALRTSGPTCVMHQRPPSAVSVSVSVSGRHFAYSSTDLLAREKHASTFPNARSFEFRMLQAQVSSRALDQLLVSILISDLEHP
jgi:hypothetical protein